MRSLAAVLFLCLATTSAAAAPASRYNAADRSPDAHCARPDSYLANGSELYRGKPLTPRKLTQLPTAIPYMAVYRQVGGCEAPLTMSAYRGARQR